ncbi:polysaccharide deacetylase family protein [uncultured Enterovirga sp.]|uniref:polysaccharide deacetylase family protein n=1 Tax=uncultured Enterovirga sp. TaxID=2026352 RepID=UPI0035CC47E4
MWPNGARCVVAITVDFDGRSNEAGKGLAPLGIHAAGRYSARRGVHRHLRLLERQGIPATFFVPGYDARTAPEVVRDIVQAGHEIGAHGYKHEGMLLPSDEEERRLILSHQILGDLVGSAPVGWRSPSGQKTSTTLRVLRSLGYLYDSSDKDFDMPYLLNFSDGRDPMVEIPNNTLSLNDTPWYNVSMTPSSEVEAQWKAEFDEIHANRGFFLLTYHPRAGFGSGTPARAAAISGLIDHIKLHRDVAFVTLAQLCDWVRGRPEEYEEVTV